VLKGTFDTGALTHELSVGASTFRRTLNQRPYVYDYVGTANIDEVNPPYFAPSPNQPGPSGTPAGQLAALAVRARSSAPRLAMAGTRRWSLSCALNESAFDDTGALQRHTVENKLLPQAAVLWQPTAAADGLCQLQRKPCHWVARRRTGHPTATTCWRRCWRAK
jgi:iron complex outermembrane receptor protein